MNKFKQLIKLLCLTWLMLNGALYNIFFNSYNIDNVYYEFKKPKTKRKEKAVSYLKKLYEK